MRPLSSISLIKTKLLSPHPPPSLYLPLVHSFFFSPPSLSLSKGEKNDVPLSVHSKAFAAHVLVFSVSHVQAGHRDL